MHNQENKQLKDSKTLREFNNYDRFFIFLGFATVKLFQLIYILGMIGCIFLGGLLLFFQPLILSNSSYPLGIILSIILLVSLRFSNEIFFSINLCGYKKIGKEAFLFILCFLITLPGIINILNPENSKQEIDLSWPTVTELAKSEI